MRSSIFHNLEKTDQEDKTFVLQSPHMLLVNLNGEVYAKQGSMAAYQGDIDFSFHGGGIGRALKKIVTGENLQLMKCSGQGDLFLADAGYEVYLIELENEELSINSSSLLAFSADLKWDVSLIRAGVTGLVAGGIFNITLTGTGTVAITSWGTPLVLQIDQPTYADVNCAIAWTTSLNTEIHSSFKAGALIGRGSGEAFQMSFSGPGFVVVQPGEGPPIASK